MCRFTHYPLTPGTTSLYLRPMTSPEPQAVSCGTATSPETESLWAEVVNAFSERANDSVHRDASLWGDLESIAKLYERVTTGSNDPEPVSWRYLEDKGVRRGKGRGKRLLFYTLIEHLTLKGSEAERSKTTVSRRSSVLQLWHDNARNHPDNPIPAEEVADWIASSGGGIEGINDLIATPKMTDEEREEAKAERKDWCHKLIAARPLTQLHPYADGCSRLALVSIKPGLNGAAVPEDQTGRTGPSSFMVDIIGMVDDGPVSQGWLEKHAQRIVESLPDEDAEPQISAAIESDKQNETSPPPPTSDQVRTVVERIGANKIVKLEARIAELEAELEAKPAEAKSDIHSETSIEPGVSPSSGFAAPIEGEHPASTRDRVVLEIFAKATNDAVKLTKSIEIPILGPYPHWEETKNYRERKLFIAGGVLELFDLTAQELWEDAEGERTDTEEGDGEDAKVKATLEAHRAALKKLNPNQKTEFWAALRMTKIRTPGKRHEQWNDHVAALQELQGSYQDSYDNMEEHENFDSDGTKRELYEQYTDADLDSLAIE